MFTEGSVLYEIGYFCRVVIITVLILIAAGNAVVGLSRLLDPRRKNVKN